MAALVHEVMNREALMFRPTEAANEALGLLKALGVSGAPVIDDDRRPLGVVSWRDLVDAGDAPIGERMTRPALTVREDEPIAHVGTVLATKGIHRLPVVDASGRVIGVVSSLDVVRAATGEPIRHPAAFPHMDAATGAAWTDNERFELDASNEAPDRPGVLVVVESVPGERDEPILVEACGNVRARLLELLSSPPSAWPAIARWLEHPSALRFRASAIEDRAKREAVARLLASRMRTELRAELLR